MALTNKLKPNFSVPNDEFTTQTFTVIKMSYNRVRLLITAMIPNKTKLTINFKTSVSSLLDPFNNIKFEMKTSNGPHAVVVVVSGIRRFGKTVRMGRGVRIHASGLDRVG
jgi:hypothetical protein